MTEKDYMELADLLYPNVLDTAFYFNKYKKRNVSGCVTRIAPSPTGYLHIGQLYQAVVHRMLANKTNGLFYARLEDTDSKREVENAGEIAYTMLNEFGLTPDEGYRGDYKDELGDYGPYVQSKRLPIYYSFAHELVKKGRAFPCFCAAAEDKTEILKRREEELETSEDLEVKDVCRNLSLDDIKKKLKEGKPFALRLLSLGDPSKEHDVKDLIKGTKPVRENAKDDVLIKSNGVPVYAFAHIVDDTLMGTNPIIRGQEWYQSLPVHLEIADAFGLPRFTYAHTPNICTVDETTGNKRKISKRKDTFADVRFFLEKGYPKLAVIEYLLNLLNSDFEVWRKNNPTTSYKDFPFELSKIGVTNPLFDFVKLNDISKTIISKYTADEVYKNLVEWADVWNKSEKEIITNNKDALIRVLSIDRGGDRPRKDITYYSEVMDLYNYVLPNFKPNWSFELGAVKKSNLIEFLKDYQQNYVESVDNTSWFEVVKTISANHNFVDNKIYKQQPDAYAGNVSDATKFIRLAITGKENSPELFSIMKILGENECKTRLQNLIYELEK